MMKRLTPVALVAMGTGTTALLGLAIESAITGHLPDLRTLALLTVLLLIPLRELSTLTQPPGTGLANFLRDMFGKRVYQELLEQHLCDHRDEWVEAHAEQRRIHARWIRVRCWIVLLWSVMGALPIEKIRALLVGDSSSRKKASED